MDREGIKKAKGLISIRIKNVIGNYNTKMRHRSHKMTPNDALLIENRKFVIENRKFVIENIVRYKNEFKTKNIAEFDLNQRVIIKIEVKRTKMDYEFEKVGFIKRRLSNKSNEVELANSKSLIRHSSQLKPWRENVGCNMLASINM
ncbi:hypothetical protein DMUE_4963 [Dictyocoela muelleri]|nr:hypothetical protein DMUE_4963 [Dictyocoela muelleri]